MDEADFKEAVKELKTDLSKFFKEYYEEIRKIWIKIVELETQSKFYMMIYGGIISIIFSIVTTIIIKHFAK